MTPIRFILIFSILLLSSFYSISQKEIPIDQLDRVADNVGGKAEFKRFFNQELIYPEKSFKEKIGGKVVLKFIVKADGSASDLKVIKSVNPEIDNEAARLFSYLQWVPTLYRKDAIDSYSTIEFNFNPKQYEKICKRRGYEKIKYPEMPIDSSIAIDEKVDELPVYIEGNFALQDFIGKNLEYPEQAKLQNIQGTVVLGFIVEASGMITNIAVEKFVGAGCDQEATRVLTLIKWKPGIKNEKVVRTKMKLPIKFELNNSFKDNSHSQQR